MSLPTKVFGIVGGLSALAFVVGQNTSSEPEKVVTPVVEKRIDTKSNSSVTSATKVTPVAAPIVKPTESKCHPSYSGCLKVNAGDYDCASGSGNGPNYTGRVEVYGSDPFDLDRDNDGVGCE